MRNLIDDPNTIVEKMLLGAVIAHPYLKKLPNLNSVIYQTKQPSNRQVTLISGGGSGHEPLDLGYVGAGGLDAAIMGDPFLPPTVEQIVDTVSFFPKQRPVLFIVKNFQVDCEAFQVACAQLNKIGYQTAILVVNDDYSVDPKTKIQRRRGVAGIVLVHKILGAASDSGLNLNELLKLGQNVIDNLFTLGFALSGTDLPTNHKPSFSLNKDEVSFGIGIHGEPGYLTIPYQSAELLARELVNKLLTATNIQTNENFMLLINGLGSLPLMDQFVFTKDVSDLIELKQKKPTLTKVGNYLTSYNMNGISISILKIEDPSWLTWLLAPTHCFGWEN